MTFRRLFLCLCLAYTSLPAQDNHNPVLSGDHPDPSIIRMGAGYWATSTSFDWAPIFPLFHSTDLRNWTAQTAVFTNPPDWAVTDFWAPEITLDKGRIRIYYAARNRSAHLCVGVATAERPEGPYSDHGPLVCQQDGSIDPFFVRDQNGLPYLVWKEDGNSRDRPTKIFAQPTTEDGLRLTGEPHPLIVNDTAWEDKVVEAPDLLWHDGWLYMLYAGGACCGAQCSYGVGVARAKNILGPWEKNPANPIVTNAGPWKCPGHGTAVEDAQGNYHFMYHAYSTRGSVYTGRETLLDDITWNADGWPVIDGGRGPSGESAPQPLDDDFSGPALLPTWQWPIDARPGVRERGGELILAPDPDDATDPLGAVLAQSIRTPSWTATTLLITAGMPPDETAAVGVIVDKSNATGIGVRGGRLVQWRLDDGAWKDLATAPLAGSAGVWLRLEASTATRYRAYYSADGSKWTPLGNAVDVTALPPWDRGLRVGFTCRGGKGASAAFRGFHLHPAPAR